MRAREAKDLLVAQTAEQAALEGVPLSDLEKRMMYFTESGYVPEDPLKLNDEFEAEYDTDEYEVKISRLLRHAYYRLRKENDAARKNWDLAIRCLRRGDHCRGTRLAYGDHRGRVPRPVGLDGILRQP